MENEFSEQEKERYKKSGVTIKMKAKIQDALKDASSKTLEKYDWLISEFSVDKEFCAKDIKTVFLGTVFLCAVNILKRSSQPAVLF